MSSLFSTKSRYALRFMLDLAQHPGWVSLKDSAERSGISRKYLEQISSLLVKAVLVESKRGKDGGYCLARSASDISVAEIIRATETTITPVACSDCKGSDSCPSAKDCETLPLWKELGSMTNDFLDAKKLSDLL